MLDESDGMFPGQPPWFKAERSDKKTEIVSHVIDGVQVEDRQDGDFLVRSWRNGDRTITAYLFQQLDILTDEMSSQAKQLALESNKKYEGINWTRKLDILTTREDAYELVLSYLLFQYDNHEAYAVAAALGDGTYIDYRGEPKTLSSAYIAKIRDEYAFYKEEFIPEIQAALTTNQSWTYVLPFRYEGAEEVSIKMLGDRAQISIEQLQSDPSSNPPYKELSSKTTIWMRDCGFPTPDDLTPAQLQRIVTSPSSMNQEIAEPTVPIAGSDKRTFKLVAPNPETIKNN